MTTPPPSHHRWGSLACLLALARCDPPLRYDAEEFRRFRAVYARDAIVAAARGVELDEVKGGREDGTTACGGAEGGSGGVVTAKEPPSSATRSDDLSSHMAAHDLTRPHMTSHDLT